MDAWENDQHKILVKDIVRICEKYIAVVCWEDTEEKRSRMYTSLVIRGYIRGAVQWITERERGSVFQPRNMCTKTGETVLQVLHSKHLEVQPETAASNDIYAGFPTVNGAGGRHR